LKVKAAQLALTRAEEASTKARQKLEDATTSLNEVQFKIHTGQLKGAAAADALAAATRRQRDASQAWIATGSQVNTAQRNLNDATNAGSKAMSALNDKFGGAAQTAAESFRGKLEAAKVQVEDIAAKVGLKLIPILERLGVDVAAVVSWLTKHKAASIALAAAIGAVTTALIGVFVVNKVADAIKSAKDAVDNAKKAWAALNVVLDANPYVALAIGIAAVVAGLIIAYKKVGWFHDAVNDVWQFLKRFAVDAARIGSAIGKALFGPIKLQLDWFARAWNDTLGKVHIHTPHVLGLPSIDIGFPKMPVLHTGGIFDSGHGEGPALLRDGEGVFTPAQMRALGGAGPNVTINTHAQPTASWLDSQLRRHAKRNGRTS
jgi:hypothetical protein